MKPPFESIRGTLPVPRFDEHPEFVDLYWKAWELAWNHVKELPGLPQSPYMDEGFCDTDIWIWDSCFMSLFCKYAPQNLFPGRDTLRNFYGPLCDGVPLPAARMENVPQFVPGVKPGDVVPLMIDIADNPPLFAWAEYENALFQGDIGYLKTLLLERRSLQTHYDFLESLTEPRRIPGVRNQTRWMRREFGYLWEGGCSGMDNTPRGRTGPHAEAARPNNPDMLWLDAISQQALSARCIARMAERIGDRPLADFWRERCRRKQEIIRSRYWDEADGFFYDIDQNTHEFHRVLTVASFWPLLAGAADARQARSTLRALTDDRLLGGEFPWTSLARNDADFAGDDGDYWRGSIWLPTAYAGMRGCADYGFFEPIRESALKLLSQMERTYREYSPHTIWECYSPNLCAPAHSCDENHRIVRPDFCGWSALGPISIFIEFVIGIHSVDAFRGVVKWRLPAERRGACGIRRLTFGDRVVDLLAEGSTAEVSANRAFTLEINGVPHAVRPGHQRLAV